MAMALICPSSWEQRELLLCVERSPARRRDERCYYISEGMVIFLHNATLFNNTFQYAAILLCKAVCLSWWWPLVFGLLSMIWTVESGRWLPNRSPTCKTSSMGKSCQWEKSLQWGSCWQKRKKRIQVGKSNVVGRKKTHFYCGTERRIQEVEFW